MKKLIIIITIVFGIIINGFTQEKGLFGYGESRETTSNRDWESNTALLNLPGSHGETEDQGAPLGSGVLLLISFGATYALRKQKRE